jgi:dipeptidase E
MKAMLTSSLGGSTKIDGKRIPTILLQTNGLLENLKKIWINNAKVLIICGSPYKYEKNDSVYLCLKEAFPMSGLSISSIEKCDDRNRNIIENLREMDVVVLAGGHVPTQNLFLKQLNLKERLLEYKGILVAWSAGAMNCAEKVYASPELEGEAINPLYDRWIDGIGITNVNILPHFQALKDDYLDGLRLIEDITFADSMGHEIVALNDGSYILIEDKHETLYGEAYLIKDGQIKQICKDNESITLR